MALEVVVDQEGFSVDGGSASGGSGCDGLLIGWIGNVAGCEYSLHACAGRFTVGLDISSGIELELSFEE